MLFELNNNDYDLGIDLDYFNLKKYDLDNYNKINYNTKQYNQNYKDYNKMDYNKTNNTEIDLENGYYLGNLFTNTYDPYKNYKPKKINAYSERQKMLLRLQELDFILNDLNLYLDINPNDTKVFEMFKKNALEYNMLKKKYYEKYQVLELSNDTKNKYTWLENPWPWDGGYYV